MAGRSIFDMARWYDPLFDGVLENLRVLATRIAPLRKGMKALVDGVTELDGELPVNPSGGLKARGHPVGASGLAQVVEIVWQLRGEAGKRQVQGAKTGLTQSIGGLASNNLVNILEAV